MNNHKLRPWPKSVSGNPGGRPKGLAAKAREHTDRCLEVLSEGFEDPDPRVRIVAAKELLDRGWARPAKCEVVARLRPTPWMGSTRCVAW